MSAVTPISFFQNYNRMAGMSYIRLGPFSNNSFREGFLLVLHEASNTGRTGVV